MTPRLAAVAAALVVLTLLGWLYFPGHTFLQSDTQIYLPILDRLLDSSLFSKDPVALRPHVSYTIYDELAVAGRRLTGAEFSTVLFAQQLLWRLCGLIGAFLIGRGLGLAALYSLLLAAIYGLGGTVAGPSVLILEYEPVPRGFAGPLVVLAAGLASTARWRLAGVAAGLAILYHPPTTVPLLAVFAIMTLIAKGDRSRSVWIPIATGAALVYALSKAQAGVGEPQRFLGTVDGELEALQRLRGAYNWVTTWGANVIRHYEVMLSAAFLLWRRLPAEATREAKWILGGLPVLGALGVLGAYLMMDQGKLAFAAQFQPARGALFVNLAVLLLAAANGIRAASQSRIVEALASFYLAYVIPMQSDCLVLLLPDLRDPLVLRRVLTAAGLAMIALAAVRVKREPVAALACAAAMLLPIWLMPGFAQVRNYPVLDHPEIHELSDWAKNNTRRDAVFLFADGERELFPGLFRVYAQRNLYVDWKGGGQVNLLRDFAIDWKKRWDETMGAPLEAPPWPTYRRLGIDYVVLTSANRVANPAPAYANAKYAVYALAP